jgi:hypothetical protein
VTVTFQGGAEVMTPAETVEVGDPDGALRILDFRRDGTTFTVLTEGRSGRTYELVLRSATPPVNVQGAQSAASRDGRGTLRFTVSGEGEGYRRHEIRFTLPS